ncbi:MAG TPA: hypothetical protein VK590_05040 [Saprospiraceae bacterium]|nr:hypothetical protein [Saprospiraceae bacterium]
METNVQNSNIIEKEIVSSSEYVAMGEDTPASELHFLNNTGQDLMIRQDNGGIEGIPYLCPTNSTYRMDGICNINQAMVALASDSTPANVQARLYA